jgi:hypothetical protein
MNRRHHEAFHPTRQAIGEPPPEQVSGDDRGQNDQEQ